MNFRSVATKSLPFTALICAATVSQAQVTYYPNVSSPTYLNKFSVGSDGTVYFSNSTTTQIYGSGGLTSSSFSVQGVSADGTVYGGRMAGMGSVGGYLDSTGAGVDFTYSPNNFFAAHHEGDYTVSAVGQFYFGDTQLGSRSNVQKLNSQGSVLSGASNNASVISSSGAQTILTGLSGIYTDRQAWDLTSTGKVLLSKTVETAINPYNATREFAFSTYDAATGALLDLPTLPQGFSQSSSTWSSVLASTNDSGDIVAAVLKGSHQASAAEIWHYNSFKGWSNLTQAYGVPSISFLDKIEITNEGIIYGVYQGGFSQTGQPWKGFTMRAPVPEPSSMILLALGAGGFIASRRRKSRA